MIKGITFGVEKRRTEVSDMVPHAAEVPPRARVWVSTALAPPTRAGNACFWRRNRHRGLGTGVYVVETANEVLVHGFYGIFTPAGCSSGTSNM